MGMKELIKRVWCFFSWARCKDHQGVLVSFFLLIRTTICCRFFLFKTFGIPLFLFRFCRMSKKVQCATFFWLLWAIRPCVRIFLIFFCYIYFDQSFFFFRNTLLSRLTTLFFLSETKIGIQRCFRFFFSGDVLQRQLKCECVRIRAHFGVHHVKVQHTQVCQSMISMVIFHTLVYDCICESFALVMQ